AEEHLRLILPFAHPKGSRKGPDALGNYREGRIDGETLGLLIKQFKQAVAGDVEQIKIELKEFLDARNELVHHFYRNPRFYLFNAEGAHTAVTYLDEQHERTRGWVSLFRQQSAAVLLLLIDNNPHFKEKYSMHRAVLIERLP